VLHIQIGAAIAARDAVAQTASRDAVAQTAQTYTSLDRARRQLNRLERGGETAVRRGRQAFRRRRRDFEHEVRDVHRGAEQQAEEWRSEAADAAGRLRRIALA
jgi:hypothetical protein